MDNIHHLHIEYKLVQKTKGIIKGAASTFINFPQPSV